jgi:hypothetical protein
MKRTLVIVPFVLLGLVMAATGLARPSRAGHTRAAASAAPPDQVIEWNQELLTLLQVQGAQSATIHPTRTLAITQLAVYDAVNAVEGGFQPYLFHGTARHASAPAAAAAAAHTVLLALLPTQQQAIDAQYKTSLAQVGSGHAVDRGIKVGEAAANAILNARSSDAATVTPTPYTPQPGPGEYQLTPPSNAPAGFTQTAHVTPFVIGSASQFRSPAPPALTSAQYADDFNEVKALGEMNSTSRSSDQTAIGKFWGAAPIWIVWNQIAEQAVTATQHDLEHEARTFALLDATLGDGAIALYDAKYAYHRWRPITAIRATDQGNPNTVSNPTWTPLANTANDPSYPGAHANFSQAAATVLADALGSDNFTFSLSNSTTGITRSFVSFSQAADEASASRIFAGQHFRYDENAGQTLGSRVADFVLDTALLPQASQARAAHHRRG